MISIRPFQFEDWSATWRILEPVFRTGETYSFDQDISESQARQTWIDMPAATFVAEDKAGEILGTYFIKPNQSGNGAHICNCGYIVSSAAQGKGVAGKMCQHSQEEARLLGFRAMQYNFVVSTNSRAVRLWQKHGFEIVGTVPEAFFHPKEGYVDAYIMHKRLET